MSKDMVAISKVEFNELVEAKEFLIYLEMAGVKCWEGYERAQQIKEDKEQWRALCWSRSPEVATGQQRAVAGAALQIRKGK